MPLFKQKFRFFQWHSFGFRKKDSEDAATQGSEDGVEKEGGGLTEAVHEAEEAGRHQEVGGPVGGGGEADGPGPAPARMYLTVNDPSEDTETRSEASEIDTERDKSQHWAQGPAVTWEKVKADGDGE